MLNETYYWSLPFGRWNGIPIRAHLLLFLAAILIVGIEYHIAYHRPVVIGTSLATLTMGAIVVLSHVLAQVYAFGRNKVQVKAICFVPWGALYHFGMDVTPRQRIRCYSMGIFANIALLSIGLTLLALLVPQPGQSFSELINPFQPRRIDWANVDRSLVEIFTWLNLAAVIIQLVPIVPLDMGYLLEAWSDLKLRRVDAVQRYTMLFVVGQFFAISLFAMAYFVRDWTEGPLRPAWLWPILSGTVLLFAARQNYLRRLQEYLPANEYNPSLRPVPAVNSAMFAEEGQWSPESRNEPESKEQWDAWMEEHHVSRTQAQTAQDQSEDVLLDGLLLKVSDGGLESLSKEERDILDRVSLRYRSRRTIDY